MSFHTPPPGSYANYLEEKRIRTNQNSNYAREIKSLLSFFFSYVIFRERKKTVSAISIETYEISQFNRSRSFILDSTGRNWFEENYFLMNSCDMENHKLLTVIKRKCHIQPMSFRIRKENYSFSTSKSDSNLIQYFHNLSC